LGEGKTAEVLRNICYEILFPEIPRGKDYNPEVSWNKLIKIIKTMFGVDLNKPEYIKSLGIVKLEFIENKITYDISSGGRGFLQTLLLFAYMFANPNTVLLLDEPDAHLEVIRQRETFQRINEMAQETKSQKRGLENYFATPNLLMKHAKLLQMEYPQFSQQELEQAMQQAISDYTLPAYLKNLSDEWWNTEKLSDKWLDKIFPAFYKQLGVNFGLNFKKNYYQLISLLDKKDISNEISEKLDIIYELLTGSEITQ